MLRHYLIDKTLAGCFWLFSLILLNLGLLLDPNHRISHHTLLYVDLLLTLLLVAYLMVDYLRQRKFNLSLKQREEAGIEALSWPLKNAQNFEQKNFQVYANLLLKGHQQIMENYLNQQKDQGDYIDSWVHEIKVPLAAAKLLTEASEEELSLAHYNDLTTQLDRIQHYVEQVLYYSRLESFSRDYLIQEYNLKQIVTGVLRENAHEIIQKNLHLTLDLPTEIYALTDEKWLHFILNQLLNNSIKYTPEAGELKISIHQDKQGSYLIFNDSGIGIPAPDLNRIFDKGFTGNNGRTTNQQATGLGLYLAKALTEKLGHELSATSTVNEGTTMTIHIPFHDYYNQAR